MLLDVFKVATMEMHRRADHADVSDDVFDRCVTCTNAALMKGEYQAMVDSVRESLPLNMGTGCVTFHEDHAKHELIKYSNQLMFVELPSKVFADDFSDDEFMFQRHGEVGRQGLGLDHHPSHT